jgi:hypothetical protein
MSSKPISVATSDDSDHRVVEDAESRMATLRAALVEGEESGPAEAFDVEAFFLSERRTT